MPRGYLNNLLVLRDISLYEELNLCIIETDVLDPNRAKQNIHWGEVVDRDDILAVSRLRRKPIAYDAQTKSPKRNYFFRKLRSRGISRNRSVADQSAGFCFFCCEVRIQKIQF
ncbi:hypothetical protein CDAR_375101 [Caerostris darwini]|uniref:Uncharacterized protein n=1 Tax=Caerostris darwini TaxID=1538125 RepID=A0AAV4RPS4_9ARAC|nr:hypothetical protein CDAR_375101 [Caerostris darwini]